MEVGHVGSLWCCFLCHEKILWGNKNVDQTHSAAAWHNQILSEQKSYKKMQRWGCSSLILIKEKSSEIYCMWISWSLAGWFLCLGKEKSKTWITKSCNRCTIVALWARDAIMLALLWGWIHVWSRVYLLNRVGVVELPCRMCSVFEKIQGQWWFFGTTIIWCQWMLLMEEIRLTTWDVKKSCKSWHKTTNLNWWTPHFWTINRYHGMRRQAWTYMSQARHFSRCLILSVLPFAKAANWYKPSPGDLLKLQECIHMSLGMFGHY